MREPAAADHLAGANMLLATEVMSSPEARERIKVCSASGIHVLSIPQYIISGVISRMSIPEEDDPSGQSHTTRLRLTSQFT